jgi:hypothetical protein
MIESTENPDATTDAGVRISKELAGQAVSNPNSPQFVFVNGLFGCIFRRS